MQRICTIVTHFPTELEGIDIEIMFSKAQMHPRHIGLQHLLWTFSTLLKQINKTILSRVFCKDFHIGTSLAIF